MAEKVDNAKQVKRETINMIKPNIVLSITVKKEKDKKSGEDNLYQMLLPARASLAESYAIAESFKDMIKTMIDDAVKKTQKDAEAAKRAKDMTDNNINDGEGNEIVGQDNIVKGNNNTVIGKKNTIINKFNLFMHFILFQKTV